MLKFPIIYICLSKKLYFSTAESKYSGYFLGELCCLNIIPQRTFFFENWISMHIAYLDIVEISSKILNLNWSFIYVATPPTERGVGSFSKEYPGIFGLDVR